MTPTPQNIDPNQVVNNSTNLSLLKLYVDTIPTYDGNVNTVALRNATMAIGRSRRPRGPTYARGANRSQFEDPELAVNARHLATRRAHPAFKFFTSLIPEAESFNLESFVPATTGGLEEHMLPPQMSG
jgi:hypothetical protein